MKHCQTENIDVHIYIILEEIKKTSTFTTLFTFIENSFVSQNSYINVNRSTRGITWLQC